VYGKFKVGEFARLAQTSVKTLHHYDEIGLLRPAHVEEATGYRYYAPTQLPRLVSIFTLRDLGFSLDQIGALLDTGLTQEQIAVLLRAKRAELQERVRLEQTRLDEVTRRLERVERDGGTMFGTLGAYEVQIKPVEALPIAALRCALSDPHPEQIARTIQQGFRRLFSVLAQRRARHGGPSIICWLDAERHEAPGDLLIAASLSGPLPDAPSGHAPDGVCALVLPAAPTVASVVYHGPVRTIEGALLALFEYVEQNGWRISGPRRDLMWQYGGDPASSETVDEVQFAVERAGDDRTA
jgi:DNA-binding transcriptional MerR regulator